MTLNFWSLCLRLLSVQITACITMPSFIQCWELSPELPMCLTLSMETCPQLPSLPFDTCIGFLVTLSLWPCRVLEIRGIGVNRMSLSLGSSEVSYNHYWNSCLCSVSLECCCLGPPFGVQTSTLTVWMAFHPGPFDGHVHFRSHPPSSYTLIWVDQVPVHLSSFRP